MAKWGLDEEQITHLGERLREYHHHYRRYMKTKTHGTSEYGYHYLSGLLRMEKKRHMAGIAHTAGVPEQNLQQFITDSPWSGEKLIAILREEICENPHFQKGSMLILDESAEEKSGEDSVGRGRQYNGRVGKVALSQVGVFLGLSKNGYHYWINGELYIPAKWFTPEYEKKRLKTKLPEGRAFQTKLELALQMVKRAKEQGLAFEAVTCNSLYGRSAEFRQALHEQKIEYYADIPADTTVYLEKPLVITTQKRKHLHLEVIGVGYQVQDLIPQLPFETITLRPSERGMLTAPFARCRVWLVAEDGRCTQEWLIIRRDSSKHTYSLSNASPDCEMWTMARRKSERYLIERANQDAKSELGWDEFQAQKYTAWVHHLALTIMASHFILETLLEWAEKHPPHSSLRDEYETEHLPNLSIGNVRTLLRAALPLPQLSPKEAAELVVKHLDNRTRSRNSRQKKARR